ncbi:hypothetical protein A9B99_20885 [Mangrovibacter phragmitis]|jgi:uncharacterized membrane protein YedE/YeeE|uniref:Transporter n=1 Tax=Mangrovibacter phragmitis TaxID=1691903 RepID=A0A1B7L5R1_9ENTR|nr:DUF6691 family protein [Mangrovibacter phragmitis]OAT77663.1 hypothetical protein A9B99_20885 [Mangrovibacter phragmitis]
MRIIVSFIAGLVFGLGLLVSGMANPAKVQGFLDLAHPWDPSLALVMAGAIAVGVVGFSLAKRRKTAICGGPISLPTRRTLDKDLFLGAAIFGLGWGIAGICPGPALVLVGAGYIKGVLFAVAMLAGMWLVGVLRPASH